MRFKMNEDLLWPAYYLTLFMHLLDVFMLFQNYDSLLAA